MEGDFFVIVENIGLTQFIEKFFDLGFNFSLDFVYNIARESWSGDASY